MVDYEQVKSYIIQITEDVTGMSFDEPETRPEYLIKNWGLDDFDKVDFLNVLKNDYQIEISDQEFEACATIDQLIKLVLSKMPNITGKRGREVDCTGLENRQLEMVRGFESHRFRQSTEDHHMGDSRSRIEDDENDWAGFKDVADIKNVPYRLYSVEAKLAKQGYVEHGYKGEVLKLYVNTEVHILDLQKKIEKARSDFQFYLKLREDLDKLNSEE